MNFFITTLVSQFSNSSLFFKSDKYLKNPPNNTGMKIIQLVLGRLAHKLAKYGANLLVGFVFTTDLNFLKGKLNAGKITVLSLCKLNWIYCKDLQLVSWTDSMTWLLSARCIIIVFMY